MSPRAHPARAAFTLVELLVVIAILGLLTSLLLPALSRARESGRSGMCRSNLRQVHAGNVLYADEEGTYVAAAPDIFDADNQRWHGIRDARDKPFDPSRGPLVPYLGETHRVKMCPSFAGGAGFESGCGGYGYNDRGVGTQGYLLGYNEAGVAHGMAPSAIRDPASTVMFADAAYVQKLGGQSTLIEYSFAEAYRQLSSTPPPREAGVSDPTVHFRHNSRANVVWCDGHVSSEPMTTRRPSGIFTRVQLGWFGGADNALFDPN